MFLRVKHPLSDTFLSRTPEADPGPPLGSKLRWAPRLKSWIRAWTLQLHACLETGSHKTIVYFPEILVVTAGAGCGSITRPACNPAGGTWETVYTCPDVQLCVFELEDHENFFQNNRSAVFRKKEMSTQLFCWNSVFLFVCFVFVVVFFLFLLLFFFGDGRANFPFFGPSWPKSWIGTPANSHLTSKIFAVSLAKFSEGKMIEKKSPFEPFLDPQPYLWREMNNLSLVTSDVKIDFFTSVLTDPTQNKIKLKIIPNSTLTFFPVISRIYTTETFNENKEKICLFFL